MSTSPLFLEASLEIKTMKYDIERIKRFDEALGFPSRQFQSVHVGGTNGKGTVSYKLACALQTTGKKVGLFTSPHLHSFTERIQVNSVAISTHEAEQIYQKIKAAISEPLSYFELLTLIGFCYFAEKKVDIAVIEVGMGGRLDATNIINPVLSIVTSIGYDHMPYLGNTLEKIAFEKAGIIKKGIPLVLGPYAQPREVFEKIASEKKSSVFLVPANRDYEEENQAIVEKALLLLPFKLSERAFLAAKKAKLPCRFQQVYPNIIFDVGHNLPALERTFEKMALAYPNKKVRALVGFSKDKDSSSMLSFLKKATSGVHLTQANHPRALDVSEIKGAEPIFEKAFASAFHLAQKDNHILLVFGSFFIMPQAFDCLSHIKEGPPECH